MQRSLSVKVGRRLGMRCGGARQAPVQYYRSRPKDEMKEIQGGQNSDEYKNNNDAQVRLAAQKHATSRSRVTQLSYM